MSKLPGFNDINLFAEEKVMSYSEKVLPRKVFFETLQLTQSKASILPGKK